MLYINVLIYLLTYLLTYISSTIGCANFGPDWPLLFKTKFDQLILRKIIKTVATRCQILMLKCTKIDFGCSASDPTGGAYSAPPNTLAGKEGGAPGMGSPGKERERNRRGGAGRKGQIVATRCQILRLKCEDALYKCTD